MPGYATGSGTAATGGCAVTAEQNHAAVCARARQSNGARYAKASGAEGPTKPRQEGAQQQVANTVYSMPREAYMCRAAHAPEAFQSSLVAASQPLKCL